MTQTERTPTETARDELVRVLAENLPSDWFAVPDPANGGRLVFFGLDHFWLVTVEEARVAPGYQGPG